MEVGEERGGWGVVGGGGGGGWSFFFNDTATTEIYTLSLHDALPIYSPIIVYDGWLQDYEYIFDMMNDYVSYKDQVLAE